jgi:hypothetical protein
MPVALMPMLLVCSDLAAREAALAKLEAEAKNKVAEANRMVDESMMVALKNQQEKKALQEEVREGKQSLIFGSRFCSVHAHQHLVMVFCIHA